MATCPGLELSDTGGSPIGLFLWTPELSLAQDHCRLLSAQSLGPLVDPGDFSSVLQRTKAMVGMRSEGH